MSQEFRKQKSGVCLVLNIGDFEENWKFPASSPLDEENPNSRNHLHWQGYYWKSQKEYTQKGFQNCKLHTCQVHSLPGIDVAQRIEHHTSQVTKGFNCHSQDDRLSLVIDNAGGVLEKWLFKVVNFSDAPDHFRLGKSLRQKFRVFLSDTW